EVLSCLSRYYEAYLAASHVGKLSMKPLDYETDFLINPRWLRLDKRAASMILASIPEAVKTDILAARFAGTLPMLARVVVLYRPGSVAERQQILQALESPSVARSPSDAVNELRKWSRWVARALDMGLQPPDPSVLIKGLDGMTRSVLGDYSDVAFRISMLRYNLEVDTRPTIKGAQDLQQALLSELEQVAFRQDSGSPTSKAKAGVAKAPAQAHVAMVTTEATSVLPTPAEPIAFFNFRGLYFELLDGILDCGSTRRWSDELQNLGVILLKVGFRSKPPISRTLLVQASKGGASSGPIVPSGALVQDLGCQVSWTRRGGLTIRRPEHGVIKPTMVGRCSQALDLIYEIECEKLRELRSAMLVQIAINRSKAEDLSMIAGAYRCLLWGAATGRIDGFFGSPPLKPELIQKMMWLVTVAHEPHVPQADEPHVPQTDEPHVPQADEPHVPQAGGLVSMLDDSGLDLCDDGSGVGPVPLGDETDPMEEVPEKRVRGGVECDDELRGLSQEEFERICREVDTEMEFVTVYLARPLRTRTSVEVTSSAQELILRLKSEGLYVSRVHSHRARELRVQPLRRWLLGYLHGGQAPQSNGRAEAAVKWTKAAVERLLSAASLGKENWAVAANYATQEQFERVLKGSSSMLPFGTKVHVRSKVYGTGGRYDLDSRWKAGRYVGPSLEVRGGHVIRFDNGAFMTSTHLRPYLVDSDQIVDLEEYEVRLPNPERRLRAKTGAPAVENDYQEVDTPIDPDHPAELYAKDLREEEILYAEPMETLAMMLPTTTATPKRFGPQAQTQKVWMVGAFVLVHGGIAGVKNATSSFSYSTRVLVRYVKQLDPTHKFNSLAITVDTEAKQHVDAHNVGMNLIAGLSRFKGGGVEVEEPDGVKLLELDGAHTHQVFNPKYRHSTRTRLIYFAALALIGSHIFPNLLLEDNIVIPQTKWVDLEVAIQDLEDRAARLRELAYGISLRDQVSVFLDNVHEELVQAERVKSAICLSAVKASQDPTPEEEIDYESLLDSLEGDLQVVHTVRHRCAGHWIGGLQPSAKKWKLYSPGGLRRATIEEARQLEGVGRCHQ
ncbi:Wdr16, partial [Symbiodinium necroappetens]